jgi:heme-degrading monooxygenase HmoA
MIYLLVHHEVADYAAWKAAFDSALDWRTKHGERKCRIFRAVQNPNELTLMFEWESFEKAHAFVGSDELKTRMAKAGVRSTPRVEYLTEMFSVRRSAAD